MSHPHLPHVALPLLLRTQRLRQLVGMTFVASAVIELATIVLPDPDPSDHRRVFWSSMFTLSAGLLLILGRRWLSDRAVKLICTVGATLVVAVMVASVLPIGAALVCFTLPSMCAGFLFTRPQRFAYVGFLAVVSGLALIASRSTEITVATWLTTVAVCGVLIIGTSRVTERMHLLFSQLTYTSNVDALTGVLNRRAFEPAFQREVERAQSLGLSLSIAIFDLDHFKQVNDRFGHAAGDDALRDFSAILRAEIRDVDLAARLGGEEFCALLFDRDADEARAWAERVSALLVSQTRGQQIELTTSVGVASLGPNLQTAEALQLAADRALYTAKANGRRRVVVAPCGPQVRAASLAV